MIIKVVVLVVAMEDHQWVWVALEAQWEDSVVAG